MTAQNNYKLSTTDPTALLEPQSICGGVRYVARQPILDSHGNLFAYELLFRGGQQDAFSGDGDLATRTVLDNSIMFGLEQMAEGLPIFVNCTLETLIDGHARVLPSELTVLEILENIEPTPDLVSACRTLSDEGYKIALDDFTWSPAFEPLIAIADFIKLDFTITSPADRALIRDRVRAQLANLSQDDFRERQPLRFIAEKIETQADYEQALSEGFNLFQGYYFCRPLIMRGRQVPSNRVYHIKILEELNHSPMNLIRLCSLVKRDAALTYRLLRLVNSPLYGIRQEIQSIQSALIVIGEEMFRRVALLAITSEWNRNQPTEILRMAFIRAKFCELNADLVDLNPTEQYLVGLLSLMPAMLRYPMDALVAGLPLREELQQALLGDQNPERHLLDWIEHYERAEWNQCDQLAQALHLDSAALSRGYDQAVLWAQTAISFTAD